RDNSGTRQSPCPCLRTFAFKKTPLPERPWGPIRSAPGTPWNPGFTGTWRDETRHPRGSARPPALRRASLNSGSEPACPLSRLRGNPNGAVRQERGVVLVALTTIQRTLAVTGIVAACGAGVYALGTTQASGSTGQPVLPATTVATPAVTANGITVTGMGNASGTPSELQLSLSVNTQAASVSTALDAANQDMSRVRDALSAHGVADADLQTSGMSIQPNYA